MCQLIAQNAARWIQNSCKFGQSLFRGNPGFPVDISTACVLEDNCLGIPRNRVWQKPMSVARIKNLPSKWPNSVPSGLNIPDQSAKCKKPFSCRDVTEIILREGLRGYCRRWKLATRQLLLTLKTHSGDYTTSPPRHSSGNLFIFIWTLASLQYNWIKQLPVHLNKSNFTGLHPS